MLKHTLTLLLASASFCTASSINWTSDPIQDLSFTPTRGQLGFDTITFPDSLYTFAFQPNTVGSFGELGFRVNRSFDVTTESLFELDAAASISNSTTECSHGWCPGVSVNFNATAEILGCPALSFSGSDTVRPPPVPASLQVQASASASGSTQCLLAAGFHTLRETFYGYGTSPNFIGLSGQFIGTLTDPPLGVGEVPEPRYIAFWIATAWFGLLRVFKRKERPICRHHWFGPGETCPDCGTRSMFESQEKA